MANKKLSVLIVDDHEYFVERMIGLLEDVDNISSIQTAGNYQDAFRMLDNKKHDVILLDISLPGKSGIDLLQKIRQLEWNCAVIMISNFSANYYKQECKKLGAWYFLDKTSEFEMVPVLINSFHLN
jgi:DNA-binding NarL/FixJ family response regulator